MAADTSLMQAPAQVRRGDLVLAPRGRGLVYARVAHDSGTTHDGSITCWPIWQASDHAARPGDFFNVPAWRCTKIADARVTTYVQLNSGRSKLIRWDAGYPPIQTVRARGRFSRTHAGSRYPVVAGTIRTTCGAWMRDDADVRSMGLSDAITLVDCRRCKADRSWQR